MKPNIRIAKELLRIARLLMADEPSWYGPKTKAFLLELKNSVQGGPENLSVLKTNGTGRFYIEKSSVKKYIGIPVATASCNMLVTREGNDIVLKAVNFYTSHYNDLEYGEWIDSPVDFGQMQMQRPADLRFTPVNDDQTSEQISQYHSDLLVTLAAIVDKVMDEYGI